MQTEGDDALSVWFRNPESATAAGLAQHDQVVLTFADMSQRSFLQFQGRARLETDMAIRDRLYAILRGRGRTRPRNCSPCCVPGVRKCRPA